MSAPTVTRPPREAGGPARAGGFRVVVRSEWTKLRSVPWWAGALVAAAVLSIAVAALSAAASTSERVGGPADAGGPAGDPDVRDEGHLVHRPLAGDGTITARVAAQDASHDWAKAGLMLRSSLDRQAPYAALVTTPGHGVRMLWDYGEDAAGSSGGAPRWLRLTRSGDRVTGEESADGRRWRHVGTVGLDGLPETVQVGLYVGSPSRQEVERQFGGESISEVSTQGEATFDDVVVEGAGGADAPGGWVDRDASLVPGDGGSAQDGDTFTITGSGDIGRIDFGDDPVYITLQAIVVGLLAVVAVSVLFVTAEYRRGMIRTTFSATPRRGRVLAAKALVAGTAGFAVGLVAAAGMILVGSAPGRPDPSLTDGVVLRAVGGTAALTALVAVLALGAGAALRHSAGAITGVVLLLVLPQLMAGALPLTAAQWLQRLTPAAGFAVQQTRERYDTALEPWAGLLILAAYATAALALAAARLRRRDAS